MDTLLSFTLTWHWVNRLLISVRQSQNGREKPSYNPQLWVMESQAHLWPDGLIRVCVHEWGHIYIIKRRALNGDVFPSAWALNPSYASVYLSATFRCLLSTCANQSCESEWCVDSHASVSIWLSCELKGECLSHCLRINEQAQQWAGEGMRCKLEGCRRAEGRITKATRHCNVNHG